MTKDNKKNDEPLTDEERAELLELREKMKKMELEKIILQKLKDLPKDPYDKK